MSISEKKKQSIKKHILELIDKDKKNIVSSIQGTFEISATTVYRYLSELIQNEIIAKDSRRKSKYKLCEKGILFSYYPLEQKLEEDIIYDRDIFPLLDKISGDAQKIWYHSFTEIMNNAIDHASAKEIKCGLYRNSLNTTILIRDDGIGIFNKIVEYNKNVLGKEITQDDAVGELFAGKFTTDRNNHSGEGIFFTSRLMDKFIIYSDGRYFSHDSYDSEQLLNFFEMESNKNFDILIKQKGTIVMMVLSNCSRRKIDEVLNTFSDPDRGFFKTQILIKNVIPNGDPVSRSQAKRLYNNFDKFEEVELDFSGIDNIGQAFTHELFIVFKRNHPQIELIVKNANKKVTDMISRVKNTAS